MSARTVVVVGTGTDVGKTFVTAALAGAIAATGVPCVAWKPVASGVASGVGEDAEALAQALGAEPVPPLYTFEEPLSLHLAARRAGVEIDVAAIVRRARGLAPRSGVLVVETAGGLFSPLGDCITNAELARALAPATYVLVAPDRLGVLHDVGATVRAASAAALSLDLLVVSAPPVADASTGTNAAELARLGAPPVVAVFPRADARSDLTRAAAEGLAAALGLPARSRERG